MIMHLPVRFMGLISSINPSQLRSSLLKALSLTFFFASANALALNPPEPDPNPAPSVPTTCGTCPDYQGALNLPPLKGPAQKTFNHKRNRVLSKAGAPYHMVHDEIVNPSETISIVGKFDYNIVFHKDLQDEVVHTYLYGTGMSDWEYLGQYKTDSDGKISVPVQGKVQGEFIVRMIVEGDLSQADGFISVVPKGQQTVLFDIDGTLTTKDFEQVGDYLGTSVAESWGFAQETVQAYIDKGYRVIFVTGRPYWNTRDTREWFTSVINLPQWHLHTNGDGGSPLKYDTETFKREYLTYLQQEKGLDIIRAYGNAETDITSYAASGIPVSETWIIGKNAGKRGTQPLYDSYKEHYEAVVKHTPEAICHSQ